MENKEFEKEIIETFEDYMPELDNDEIWDNIEPHLKEKKKRRFLLLWFLLGGLGLAYWYGPQVSSPAEESTPQHITTEPSVSTQELVTTNGEAAPPVSKNEHSTVSHSTFLPNSLPSPSSTKKWDPQTSTMTKKGELGTETGPVVTFKEGHPKEEITQEKQKAPKEDVPPETSTDINTEEIAKVLEEKEKSLAEEILTEEKEEKEKKKKIIKPKRRHKWHSYLQASVAPVLPLKHIGLRRGSDQQVYQQERRNTETQLEAFAMNLSLQVKHKKGLVLVTGLEYQQFNERFNFEQTTVETDFAVGIVSQVENHRGEVVQINTGLKGITTTRTETRRVYNNYQFLNVPFGLGKAWNRNKLRYQIVGGLQYNWYYRFDGTILNGQLKATKLNKKIGGYYDSVFQNRAGFSFWLSSELRFAQTPRLDWVIAPKLQLPLRSLTQNDYGLSQRYFPLSLNLGVNYQLMIKE